MRALRPTTSAMNPSHIQSDRTIRGNGGETFVHSLTASRTVDTGNFAFEESQHLPPDSDRRNQFSVRTKDTE